MDSHHDMNQQHDDLSAKLLAAVKTFAAMPLENSASVTVNGKQFFKELNSLLDQGANPNWRNQANESVLYIATINNQNSLADFLIKRNAEYQKEDIERLRAELPAITNNEVTANISRVVNSWDYLNEIVSSLNDTKVLPVIPDNDARSGEKLMEDFDLFKPDEDLAAEIDADNLLDALGSSAQQHDDKSGEELLHQFGLTEPDTKFAAVEKSGDELLKEFGLLDPDPEEIASDNHQSIEMQLQDAIITENIDNLIELLQSGANIYAIDAHGKSALDFLKASSDPLTEAVVTNHQEMIEDLMSAAKENDQVYINSMLEHGLNINVVDKDGNSALHIAASEHHLDLYDYLVDKGINTGIMNHNQQMAADFFLTIDIGSIQESSLVKSINSGSLDDVRQLIKNGEDTNHLDTLTGNNAVLHAASRGKWDIVSELLKSATVDIRHQNNEGVDIAALAKEAKQDNLLKPITEVIAPTKTQQAGSSRFSLFHHAPASDKKPLNEPENNPRKSLK